LLWKKKEWKNERKNRHCSRAEKACQRVTVSSLLKSRKGLPEHDSIADCQFQLGLNGSIIAVILSQLF
jgi:hypothetical protein